MSHPGPVAFARKNFQAAQNNYLSLVRRIRLDGWYEDDEDLPGPIQRHLERLRERVRIREAQLDEAKRQGKKSVAFR